jgi:hypothetical protein
MFLATGLVEDRSGRNRSRSLDGLWSLRSTFRSVVSPLHLDSVIVIETRTSVNRFSAGKPFLATGFSQHFQVRNMFAPTASWVDADVLSIEQWWQSGTSQPSMMNLAYQS